MCQWAFTLVPPVNGHRYARTGVVVLALSRRAARRASPADENRSFEVQARSTIRATSALDVARTPPGDLVGPRLTLGAVVCQTSSVDLLGPGREREPRHLE